MPLTYFRIPPLVRVPQVETTTLENTLIYSKNLCTLQGILSLYLFKIISNLFRSAIEHLWSKYCNCYR
jgi:hypothetical protein